MKDPWLVAGALSMLIGCNEERKNECDRLVAAMKPLEVSAPTAAAADQMRDALGASAFDDQPLHEYASSAKTTLTVLASTLHLAEGPSAPDGTDDLARQKLAEARGELRDVTRYCAQ